jgi:maltose/moltooligosaccharide transporter
MFIVIPQIVAATLLAPTLRIFFDGRPIFALVISGGSLILGALCMLGVREPQTRSSTTLAAAH